MQYPQSVYLSYIFKIQNETHSVLGISVRVYRLKQLSYPVYIFVRAIPRKEILSFFRTWMKSRVTL
jgi:hypothetical protein